MNRNSRYDEYFARKRAMNSGVEDLSGPTPESAQKIDWLGNSNLTQNDDLPEQVPGEKKSGAAAGMQGAQQQVAAGGNGMDTLGGGMATMGAATGNPYLVGAGLGVSALSSITKGKNAQANARYQAQVNQYNQRQQAIQKMAEIGKGLKA